MPAQGASAPHKATVENGSKATAAVRAAAMRDRACWGVGNQQPQGSTQRMLELLGAWTERENPPEQGHVNQQE